MDPTACDGLQAWISSHLNKMPSIEQPAGDQLLIAEHFAVTHIRLQVAIGGGRNPEIFRSDPAIELSSLKASECLAERPFHAHTTVSQVQCLAATHLHRQDIHRWAADELRHKQI